MNSNVRVRHARRGAGVLIAVTALAGGLASAPADATPSAAHTAVESFGQGLLGDGTTDARSAPGKIAGLSGIEVTQVSTSNSHTLALSAGGKVYAWGDNSTGALGNGTTTSSYAPVAVTIPAGVGRVVAVAAGYDASVAVTSTGQVLTWGEADSLGDGTTTNRPSAAAIALPSGLAGRAVAAGYHFDEIVTTNGQVWGWGTNQNGNLGTGSTGTFHRPGRAKTPSTFVASSVATGDYHTVALGTDRNTGKTVVMSWGANSYGQLGAGAVGAQSNNPVVAAIPASASAIASIAAAGSESGAVDAGGGAYLWGRGLPGADATYPDPSDLPRPAGLPSGVHASALAITDVTVLASTTSEHLYGWGENVFGSLGPDAGTYESSPAAIALPAGTIGGIATSSTSYVILRNP